jgi:hypothetical protein
MLRQDDDDPDRSERSAIYDGRSEQTLWSSSTRNSSATRVCEEELRLQEGIGTTRNIREHELLMAA